MRLPNNTSDKDMLYLIKLKLNITSPCNVLITLQGTVMCTVLLVCMLIGIKRIALK